MRRETVLPWIAFALLLLVAFGAWLGLLLGQDSYPGHVDEAHLSRNALRMLCERDPSPHWFRYGSLPVYLTAAGMALGTLFGRVQGSLEGIRDVWSVAAPYYSHRVVMLVPKLMFLCIGVTGLACAGLLGRALSPRPLMLVLPWAVLAGSPLYAFHSWAYLNVDIVAAALSLGGLAYLCNNLAATGFRARVLWPSIFCGAVVAAKYNSGLLGLPFVVALAQERRYARIVWLLLCSLGCFLLFEPFALIEPDRFRADVLFEILHYRTGHPGYDGDPGLPQLWYYLRVLVDEFGWPSCVCGLVGIWHGLRTSRRAASLTLLFPLSLLLHMSTNRAHFARTVLPAIAVFSVFIALGLACCMDVAASAVRSALAHRTAPDTTPEARARARFGRWAERLAAAVVLGLTVGPPLSTAAGRAASPIRDSRVAIARWIASHAQGPCQVIVPVQMQIDPAALAGLCRVDVVNLRGRADATALLDRSGVPPALQRYAIVGLFKEDGTLSRRRAAAWRQLVAAAVPRSAVLEAGSKEVQLWHRTRDVRNPRLSVYRLP